MAEMFKDALPFQEEGPFILSEDMKDIGLVLVDPVNGFCTVGAGSLVCDYYYINFFPLSLVFLFFFWQSCWFVLVLKLFAILF